MGPELRAQLIHVLWIGGATDTGKSTIARNLSARHGMRVYHYDQTDVEHHIKLAETIPEIQKFNDASLDERWVYPEPQDLFERSLRSFSLRFSLMVEDILALPNDIPIIAEGFGLLPELIYPMLSSLYQAIWFVPGEKFKWDSMARRGKPSFANMTTDPEKAKMNLFRRDVLLADYYRRQVPAYGYTLLEIDGTRSIEEVADLTDEHFAKYHELDKSNGL